MLNKALAETGATIIDRDECTLFEGKLKWRNPLLLKSSYYEVYVGNLSLPLTAKSGYIDPQVQIGSRDSGGFYGIKYPAPHIPCRGEHDELTLPVRRVYRLHPHHAAYISDYRPDLNGDSAYYEGADIVSGVLGGTRSAPRRVTVISYGNSFGIAETVPYVHGIQL